MGRQTVRNGNWHKKTDAEFQKEMAILHPDIQPLEMFTESHVPVLCRCLRCGNEWRAQPANLTFKKRPTGCPVCSGVAKKSTDIFKVEMRIKHPDVEVIGEYIDSHTPIKCRCLRHNAIYEAIPTNLLRRQTNGCRLCYQEAHESRLANDLKEYCKLNFPGTVTEYRVVKNPVTGRFLPFDIFIPNFRDTGIDVFCEVMGQQHYQIARHWALDDEAFERLISRDVYKEAYAKAHGRYVEIDLRSVQLLSDAVALLEGNELGWVAKWAYKMPTSDNLPGATECITNAYALEM